MDWQGLSRQMMAEHQQQPQILGRLEMAINQAREALQIMAGHGHVYHLAEGPGEKHPEWPRRLYHVDSAPNGIIVYTEKEAEDLGPGWFDSLQKAQFWDGLETQFNGRGGVPKAPRVPVPSLFGKIDNDPEEATQRRALIAAFRALNRWETPHALQDEEAGQDDGRSSPQPSIRQEGGDSPDRSAGIQSSGSGEASGEESAFQKQINNFGKQGMKVEMTPPSMRPAKSGTLP